MVSTVRPSLLPFRVLGRSSPSSPSFTSLLITCLGAHVVGNYFRRQLEELQHKHAPIGDVRGMGLMQALELVKDRKTKEPAPDATTQVMERARQNGLLIGKGGLYGNVLRLAPMLNTSKSDVDEATRLLDKSFSEVRS